MAEYKHGAYGQVNAVSSRRAETTQAIVYIGTAPVHNVEGGAANVNKPILCNNIAEAKRYLGYSDDWASYTLCEAMHAHFEVKGVGPLIFINVLNPATHKSSTQTTVEKTPASGKIEIANAANIILDTVVVQTTADTPVVKVKDVDYTIAYNAEKATITITEIGTGLGTSALNVLYYTIDASAVTAADVIGSTDGLGQNTGIYAVRDIYQMTGQIPAYIVAPGFSSITTVHDALVANSSKINGHWDAFLFVDLPILNGSTPLTLDTIFAYKNTNGYNKDNETVNFPLVSGTDGKTYHLSTLRAANFQELLINQDGVPYRTASNSECQLIENLYLGEAQAGRIIDESLVNEKLNKNGIASAAFVGGRWALWGAHSASYNQTDADAVNVAETNRIMLYYISNDFQIRRSLDVDQPLTINDLQSIVSEEQAHLDALKSIGAIIFGEVLLDARLRDTSDLLSGDWSITFNVTTTPLAKSLTAVVNWTDDGFVTYFEEQA